MTSEEKWERLKKIITIYSNTHRGLENGEFEDYHPFTKGTVSAFEYILERMDELDREL